MANNSLGSIKPYVQVPKSFGEAWLEGSRFEELMEALSEISYGGGGEILSDNQISISGRNSIAGMYQYYVDEWSEGKELRKIMKKLGITRLKLYFSDNEPGNAFMEFGVIYIDHEKIEVDSRSYDYEEVMLANPRWLALEMLRDLIEEDSDGYWDWNDELNEAEWDAFNSLEEKHFNTI